MLVATGLVLLVLGIACGALMLLIPLGMVGGNVGLALWIFFPLFSITGYLMAAAASRRDHSPLLTQGSGAVLILLALAAAIALVLQAASIIEPAGSTLSLWYVLAIGIVLGATGLASRRDKTQAA
jgi:hypothetical protein